MKLISNKGKSHGSSNGKTYWKILPKSIHYMHACADHIFPLLLLLLLRDIYSTGAQAHTSCLLSLSCTHNRNFVEFFIIYSYARPLSNRNPSGKTNKIHFGTHIVDTNTILFYAFASKPNSLDSVYRYFAAIYTIIKTNSP